MDRTILDRLFTYGDWANGKLLDAANTMTDDSLDQPFDMGVGSLRRTLLHIYNGEYVWLQRWRQKADTPWPSEEERIEPAALRKRLEMNSRERAGFLAGLTTQDLDRTQVYRDSRGGLFSASLRDMILQGFLHSHHHRAQAVNMLRRLGVGLVELDYVMSLRKPAD